MLLLVSGFLWWRDRQSDKYHGSAVTVTERPPKDGVIEVWITVEIKGHVADLARYNKIVTDFTNKHIGQWRIEHPECDCEVERLRTLKESGPIREIGAVLHCRRMGSIQA